MSYTPKTVVLVDWPHSQRIMAHPEALAVNCDSDGDGSYVVPVEVWEQWKDGYYVAEDFEAPNEVCVICDAEIDGNHCYCDKCDMPVCDDPQCRGSIDPNPNHYRYCANCC